MDGWTIGASVATAAIAFGALVVAILSYRKQAGLGREQVRLAREQNELAARQNKIAEGQLTLQAGMALKDAIQFCVRDLERRGNRGKARKVALIAFDWAHNHNSSLEYVDVMRDRIYRACGVDLNQLLPPKEP